MGIVLVGVNFRSAPVALRERLLVKETELGMVLPRLQALSGVEECLLLSTCHRLEVLALGNRRASAIAAAVQAWFRRRAAERGLGETNALPLYTYLEREAVHHLLRVAAGLDSAVLGEDQILGQVKRAWEAAAQAKTLGAQGQYLLRQAVTVGKAVRSDTNLGGRSGLGGKAAGLARLVLGDLAGKVVLSIGAGETAVTVLRALARAGVETVIVANRTYDRACAVAATVGGQAVSFAELAVWLARADIVISSTSAPHLVLTAAQIAAAQEKRGGRELLLIDLAVPRDIAPEAAGIPKVTLYNIDDLAVDPDPVPRTELIRAEAMVAAALAEAWQWLREAEARRRVQHLVAEAAELRTRTLSQLWQRLPDLEEREKTIIAETLVTFSQRLLHSPLEAIKALAVRADMNTDTELHAGTPPRA